MSARDSDVTPKKKAKRRRFKDESQPAGQHSPSTVTSSKAALKTA